MATEGQQNEAFVEPPREEIPGISRQHVAYMESAPDDEAVWVVAGMHHVVLHTLGRKSGTEHKVALPFWRDQDGSRVVVASFSGATGSAKAPSSFGRRTSPDATTRYGRTRFASTRTGTAT